MTPMTPTFFETPAHFRRWLDKHHAAVKELWVGFYKVKSGKSGMVYREALDEALCYGWIDGMVRRVDEESYAQRFTPRRKTSTWSRINVKRVEELLAEGRMRLPGIEAFERRTRDRTGRYSFEQQGGVRLARAHERTFKASPEAWAFFSAQPPSYRRVATWWVMSAKKEETRVRRLLQLIADSAAGRRIRQVLGP